MPDDSATHAPTNVPRNASIAGFTKPAQLPPSRGGFATDEEHLAATVDYYWQHRAYYAVRGRDISESIKMRDEVMVELSSGRQLNQWAARWLVYAYGTSEPRNEWKGRRVDRDHYDRKELRLARYKLDHWDLAKDDKQNLEDAARVLGLSSETWERVMDNETFAGTLITLQVQGKK